ncbi:hypothetical protein Tdes44962_MAKER09333 [Teratosphaeria destructans]|uniref:Uncharacterized protein n=1 Tax=Teratosphaeria destructans TaxID=418781 RepID=A0A9W7STM8_9PEZI|nr:hypothetical protein Tdes44962_MAKER09333 [Teratosphaeria destructans]
MGHLFSQGVQLHTHVPTEGLFRIDLAIHSRRSPPRTDRGQHTHPLSRQLGRVETPTLHLQEPPISIDLGGPVIDVLVADAGEQHAEHEAAGDGEVHAAQGRPPEGAEAGDGEVFEELGDGGDGLFGAEAEAGAEGVRGRGAAEEGFVEGEFGGVVC